MSKRIKAASLASREEFTQAVDKIADLTTELRLAEAQRDKDIQAVQEKHGERITQLHDQVEHLTGLAEKFALGHRDELLPAKLKSAETPKALFGFRLGNPTLKLLSKKWNWDAVVQALKASGRKLFVRTEETADKDLLKAQLSEVELAGVGCRVEQSETFYIEPKVDGATEVKAA